MDNKTTTVKLCFDGSIHRVVIGDRTLSALRDVATQLFAGVLEFSYVDGGEELAVASDGQLNAAIENATGVPKLNVTKTEVQVTKEIPLASTAKPDRWAARINKMPRWRLEKILHTKSKKLAECSNAESRVKLTKIISQLEEAVATRPEDERDKGAHDKLKSMSRFRLEKMMHRKTLSLTGCTEARAERISAAIAAITSELATREPAETELEAKKAKKSAKTLKSRTSKKSTSTKKQMREERWNDKLHAMPRFRLENMLRRKSEKLAACPDRGDRLGKVIAEITAELATRGPADHGEAKLAKRSRKCSRKCSKAKDTQTVV